MSHQYNFDSSYRASPGPKSYHRPRTCLGSITPADKCFARANDWFDVTHVCPVLHKDNKLSWTFIVATFHMVSLRIRDKKSKMRRYTKFFTGANPRIQGSFITASFRPDRILKLWSIILTNFFGTNCGRYTNNSGKSWHLRTILPASENIFPVSLYLDAVCMNYNVTPTPENEHYHYLQLANTTLWRNYTFLAIG